MNCPEDMPCIWIGHRPQVCARCGRERPAEETHRAIREAAKRLVDYFAKYIREDEFGREEHERYAASEIASCTAPLEAELSLRNAQLSMQVSDLDLVRENDALRQQLSELGEYLWTNQTGLPNEHRNPLVAVKSREELLRQQLAARDERIAVLEDDYEQFKNALESARQNNYENECTRLLSDIRKQDATIASLTAEMKQRDSEVAESLALAGKAVSSLTKERDEARASQAFIENEKFCKVMDERDTALATIAAKDRVIAELAKDKDRLDYLEANPHRLGHCAWMNANRGQIYSMGPEFDATIGDCHSTLRAAIDAALSAAQQPTTTKGGDETCSPLPQTHSTGASNAAPNGPTPSARQDAETPGATNNGIAAIDLESSSNHK